MLIVFASVAVALVAFIVYALERRAKSEPIVWENAGKLSIFGAIITAGIVFVSTSDVKTAIETAASIDIPSAQDMFVGTPSF